MSDAGAFQTDVARLALDATREHGFALAGGHALIAHGIVSRPTEDIDLFTNEDGAVQAAAGLLARKLINAGFDVDVIPETSELGDIFYGFERDMVEFEIRKKDETIRLQLCRFDRSQRPTVMEIGPVLHINDVIGSKVAAMATRAEPRDFIDVAAALDRYNSQQLMELALCADPALTDEEFADAMRRLDRLDDEVFETMYGRTSEECAEMRRRFTDWPRT
jgi:predicted nucleotidyltransferase component of viral defense system